MLHKKSINKNIIGMLLAISGAALWGIDGIVCQFLYQQAKIPLPWLMGIKMFGAGMILLFTSLIIEGKECFAVWQTRQSRVKFLIYAILGLTGDQLAYSMAIKVSNAAMATILQCLGIVFVIIYSSIFLNQLPNRARIIAMLFALVGTWLIVTRGNFSQISLDKQTIFWGLLLALCASANNILPVNLLKKYSSLSLMGWAMVIGGILFSLRQPAWVNPPHVNLTVLVGIIFSTVMGTAVAYVCILASLNFITSTEVSILNTVEPLTAVVLGFLFLNLFLNWAEILGSLAIVSTTFILAFSDRNTQERLDKHNAK